jgi:hypothetical protein
VNETQQENDGTIHTQSSGWKLERDLGTRTGMCHEIGLRGMADCNSFVGSIKGVLEEEGNW